MIEQIRKKFQAEGVGGVSNAVFRRFLRTKPLMISPIHVAIDTITKQDHFSVIQLGAFIGKTNNDPIYEMLSRRLREVNGTLILVEPVKCFFDELVKNYERLPGVAFENVAISDRNGPATFYRLGVDPVSHGYPAWLLQLGSLKVERMRALWDSYENNDDYKEFYLKHQIEEKVDCITFEELTRRHNLSRIDLLQIDVEGCELEILKTIDFRRFPIRFVNYESVLLQQYKLDAENIMAENGYQFVDYGQDTFCFKAADKHLSKRWRQSAKSRG